MERRPRGCSGVLRGRAKRSASQRIGVMFVTSRTISMDFLPLIKDREFFWMSFWTFLVKNSV